MSEVEQIRNEVEKTMTSMDHMDTLEAGPYFYTRLQARMRAMETEAKPSLWELLGARVLRPAVLTLLLLINIISVSFMLVTGGPTTQEITRAAPPSQTTGTEQKQSYAEIFAANYSLMDSPQTINDVVVEKVGGGEEGSE